MFVFEHYTFEYKYFMMLSNMTGMSFDQYKKMQNR